jgi:hypothetical protein
MSRNILLAAVIAFTISSAPAGATQTDERKFEVGQFEAIQLTGPDSVRVVSGSTISVVASGDPRAVAALAIEVRGDTLRIGRRQGTYQNKVALVTVTMPVLRATTITGSGGIGVDGIEGRSFTASITGSGGVRLAGLQVEAARFDLSGSGSIVAKGNARAVTIDLGGSGSVDTRGLAAPTVTVDLGGSGSVAAAASRTAMIRAGGSGDVRVSGGARCNVGKSGSGTVRCD